MDDLLALSVRQPWAHAIVHLGKDVENRSRSFGRRGLVLVHASKGMTQDEFAEAAAFIEHGPGHTLPPADQLQRGGIVGAVEIIDSVAESDSPWWMGPRALVLANARPLPFIPCSGTVAPIFWRPPADVLDQVRAHLR